MTEEEEDDEGEVMDKGLGPRSQSEEVGRRDRVKETRRGRTIGDKEVKKQTKKVGHRGENQIEAE
ncbi:hypothetical protein EYF80_009577 [Liparis tanakae]|uniref:Uncharacterized protein n=1 Tax=Liparis tanakae TaxID=230148 RepID=A0A4Z2ISJ5_9TELE|nr:hypothetical protein EYF80_009577 [Liparis tanakae]